MWDRLKQGIWMLCGAKGRMEDVVSTEMENNDFVSTEEENLEDVDSS